MKIDELADLIEVAADVDGWRKLYRHRQTQKFWELDYPQSQLHGGGPPRLRELDIASQDAWQAK